MAKFKFGEKVIAKISSQNLIKQGNEYIVDGFSCCPKCGDPLIYIKGINIVSILQDDDCGWRSSGAQRFCFDERAFEKPISIADATEYKLSVSIPELTKIEEYQNQ